MLQPNEKASLRVLIQAVGFLMEGARASNPQNAAEIIKLSYPLFEAIVILLGGTPANHANPPEIAAWRAKKRAVQVSEAKAQINRVLGYIDAQPKNSWLEMASSHIRHSFHFDQSFNSPYNDTGFTIPTIVAVHGDLSKFLNRMLFGLKYWGEHLVEEVLNKPRSTTHLQHYIEAVKVVGRTFILTSDLDNDSRLARIRGLHLAKIISRDLPQHMLLARPDKYADAWFHFNLAWLEYMKFPNSETDDGIKWEELD